MNTHEHNSLDGHPMSEANDSLRFFHDGSRDNIHRLLKPEPKSALQKQPPILQGKNPLAKKHKFDSHMALKDDEKKSKHSVSVESMKSDKQLKAKKAHPKVRHMSIFEDMATTKDQDKSRA